MPELKEVFAMITEQTEPDLGSWKEQERRQRRTSRNRKIGAIAVAAAIVVAAVVVIPAARDDTTAPGNDASVRPEPGADSYFIDLTTGETTPLPSAINGSFAYSVSPNGRIIAYSDDAGHGQQVFVADIDGSNVRLVTKAGVRFPVGDAFGPSWAPDGHTLVVQGRDSSAEEVGNLFLVNTIPSTYSWPITDLRQVSSHHWYMAPRFSPDGRTVIYHLPNGDTWDAWTVPAQEFVSGRKLIEPTHKVSDAAYASYSPDGATVAYLRAPRLGAPAPQSIPLVGDGIWLDDPGGGGPRLLVEAQGIAWPRWSPDGIRIAYVRPGSGTYVVVVQSGATSKIADAGLPEWVDEDTLIVSPL